MADDEAGDDVPEQTETEEVKESETELPVLEQMGSLAKLAPPKYEVRPDLMDRFQALLIKEIIDQTMRENLTGRTYSSSQAEKWVKSVANKVRERVNALDQQSRFKLVVQVVLGEMRGAGVKSGVRCIWDTETDNFVGHMFQSESIFCHTTVFGVYFY